MSNSPEYWSERLRAKWRRPLTLTALIPVGTETETAVRMRLTALAPRLEAVLATVPDLHTLRLVAVPPHAPGESVRVLFNCVHDHLLDEHLAALMAAAGKLLAEAMTGAAFSGKPEDLPGLLLSCRVPEHTFHLGAINKSVSAILSEHRLRVVIETFADEQLAAGHWNPSTPAETIRREIRRHVLAQPPAAKLPSGPMPAVSSEGKFLRFLSLLVTFALPTIGVLAPHIVRAIRRITPPAQRLAAWVGYGLWWIYGALPTGLALLVVRLLEKIEPDPPAPPIDSAKVERIEATEDLRLKNAVTLWFTVRDTWIRRRVLSPLILWGSERGCRHFWTVGALADIDTIHYARIMKVDRHRTMLFMSDYDGSLDRYLMDFLGVGSSAVIPISSNVIGCPKTRWLFHPDNPGEFGPRWRTMIRAYQLETPVWYTAYPNLTVRDILANSVICDGLCAEEMSEADAARWTARL